MVGSPPPPPAGGKGGGSEDGKMTVSYFQTLFPRAGLSPKDVTQPSAFQEKRHYHLHLTVEASGPEKLNDQVTQVRSQGVVVKGTRTNTL